MFIFFVCPKKTNQKKGQPFTWFDYVELSSVSRNNREFENSDTVWSSHTVTLRQVKLLFRLFLRYFDCVKWPKNNNSPLFVSINHV